MRGFEFPPLDLSPYFLGSKSPRTEQGRSLEPAGIAHEVHHDVWMWLEPVHRNELRASNPGSSRFG